MFLPAHLPPEPPAQLWTQPAQLDLDQAVASVLESYDLQGAERLPDPPVAARHRPAMRWLRAALQDGPRSNPFPRGSAAWKEAQAFLALGPEPGAAKLAVLCRRPLVETGSHLLLWKLGRASQRRGPWPSSQRKAWEERLLQDGSPATLRGWTLRHALCHALADADQERLGVLKARYREQEAELVRSFQRLFAFLGGPLPRLPLWTLPGLAPEERSLSELGHRKLWFAFAEDRLPALPADTLWIIPAHDGRMPADAPALEGLALAEGRKLQDRLAKEGRTALLAPSQAPLEEMALVFFPILIRMDAEGNVLSIRMGDAAPASPDEPEPQAKGTRRE